MIRWFFVSWAAAFLAGRVAADWPEWRGSERRDGVWRDPSLPTELPAQGFSNLWRVLIGTGYSGPSVAGGRLFVMDRLKPPQAEVDTERILCFDSKTGAGLWTNAYPCSIHFPYGYENGPRGTPLVRGGRVYVLGAMGMLSCLDAKSGEIAWRCDLAQDYRIRIPSWGVASQPILEDGALIVMAGGADGATVVAFDQADGKEKWRSLAERSSYSPLIGIESGARRQVLVWTAEAVHGLEPATGAERWRFPFKCKYDEAVHTPLYDVASHRLFFPHDWNGTLTLDFDPAKGAATMVGTNLNLSMLHSAALLRDGVIYALNHNSGDKPSQGEFRAIDVRTGEILWKTNSITTPQRWAQASVTYNEGNRCAYILTDQGELVMARLSRTKIEVLGRSQLCGKTWSHPAYSDGCIFARAETSLLCARLK
jgi:outer membrane protein assembly factor BamB